MNKEEFSWTTKVSKAFEHLKEAMCLAPVLAMPDFTKTFIVECDATGQEGRHISFKIPPIKGNYLQKDIYEKEMLAILHELKKWRSYLIGRHFKVKDDHDSLKFFFDQRLSSEEKKKWVTKMLGY